jgi:hypothetical protein
MKSRSTLILALLSVALLAYVYFDSKDRGGLLSVNRQEGKLVRFEQDKAERIELTNSHGSFLFTRKDGKWQLEKPIAFPADGNPIGTFLAELEFARRIDALSEKQLGDWNEAMVRFGLKEPRIRVQVQTADDTFILSLGRDTAVPGAVYALLQQGGKRQCVILDNSIVPFFDKDLNAWREHRLFAFATTEVTAVTVRRDQQEARLERLGDDWKVTKPLATSADRSAVATYLAEVLNLTALEFVSEEDTAQSAYGLGAPGLILEIETSAGPQVLKVGGEVPSKEGVQYATLSARPAVFTLSTASAQSLSDLVDRVRDRRLVSFESHDPIRSFTVSYRGYDLSLAREGASWIFPQLGGRAAEPVLVNEFLSQVGRMRAESFPTVDARQTALAKPVAVMEFRSGEGDSAVSDRIELGAVVKESIYARSSLRDAVVTTPRSFLDQLPQNPWQWFAARLFPAGSKPLLKITWTVGTETYGVSRNGASSPWTWSQAGLEPDEEILNLQLKILQDLSALRWTGKINRRDFAKPVLTLALEREGGGKEMLVIGAELPDKTHAARLNEDEYAFALATREVQTLRLKPAKAAAPAGSPAP